jgi:DNA repair protein RecO (recombination protein O)
MKLLETEAIILRTYKLGEGDKIFLALTRHFGVVRGVAKGARRLKSRFGASLEPFTLTQLSCFEKEGSELVSLRQTEIVSSYFELASGDRVFPTLEYLAELVIEFAPPRAPDEKLFRMVKACLDTLHATPARVEAVTRYFEIWMLKLAGFLPGLGRCGGCGRTLDGLAAGVSYVHGTGLRCGKCATAGEGSLVSPRTLRLLGDALHTPPPGWVAAAEAQSDGTLEELRQFLRAQISRALEREPRGRPGPRVNAPARSD